MYKNKGRGVGGGEAVKKGLSFCFSVSSIRLKQDSGLDE